MDKFKGTPGPWRWEVNLKSKDINLVGGVPKFDLTVMDFVRYGTGGAAPRFNVTHQAGFQIMERAETMAQVVPGREHHAFWFQTLSHPDAQLIAAAPDLLAALQDILSDYEKDEHLLNVSIGMIRAAVSKALGKEAGNGTGN